MLLHLALSYTATDFMSGIEFMARYWASSSQTARTPARSSTNSLATKYVGLP